METMASKKALPLPNIHLSKHQVGKDHQKVEAHQMYSIHSKLRVLHPFHKELLL